MLALEHDAIARGLLKVRSCHRMLRQVFQPHSQDPLTLISKLHGLHSSIWSEKHLQLQGTPIRGHTTNHQMSVCRIQLSHLRSNLHRFTDLWYRSSPRPVGLWLLFTIAAGFFPAEIATGLLQLYLCPLFLFVPLEVGIDLCTEEGLRSCSTFTVQTAKAWKSWWSCQQLSKSGGHLLWVDNFGPKVFVHCSRSSGINFCWTSPVQAV
mmetsp:Transcript_62568/g.137010  ORF Transcript_62568/g.137010 Transcript_62568/m.137010 type:complete len:208 (+) Transcript_62568:541-1164(+)